MPDLERPRTARENELLEQEVSHIRAGTTQRAGWSDFFMGLFLMSPLGPTFMPRRTRVFWRAMEMLRERDRDPDPPPNPPPYEPEEPP